MEKNKHRCFSLDNLENEPDSRELIEEVIHTEQRNCILHGCMEHLNQNYREALYLVYFEGMSYSQTAQIMKKSEKQITNIVYRGKKSLRELLKQKGITNAEY